MLKNFQNLNIEVAFKVRHVIFIQIFSYLTYDMLQSYFVYEEQKTQIFNRDQQKILDAYQNLHVKTTAQNISKSYTPD